MVFRLHFSGLLVCSLALAGTCGPVDCVDTRMGTRVGAGSCLLGPCVPHGSVHPSPDTAWPSVVRDAPSPSGYCRGDKVVGFSQLHSQGTGGVPSYGIFRVVFGAPSAFEIDEARPYRLKGRLTDLGIRVAVSATEHGAVYAFDGGNPTVDVVHKIGEEIASTNAVLKTDGNVLSGGGTYAGNWNPAAYDCWFYAVRSSGELRIAVSFSSVEQARSYYDRELEGRSADQIAQQARSKWDEVLSRVEISGVDAVAATRFYTHLFHSFVQPRDRRADGLGWDDHYTLWDTWKTLFPLMTLLDPETTSSCINSFAERFVRSGCCESCYTQGHEYKVGQGGDEADCVIADAFAKSIPGVAWTNLIPLLETRWTGRTKSYRTRGWVADGEREDYCWRMKSGSGTLSFAFQDYCIGSVLSGLRGTNDVLALKFLKRSSNWTNAWNDAAYDEPGGFSGFASRRLASGVFGESSPRKDYNQSFYEATGWEYSFFVPHDLPGLIARCGGKGCFADRLEYALKNQLIDFGNEPSFQTPWLFSFADRPDLSSYWAHEVMRLFPDDGCPGDDDSGAMGAFYVFLSIGLMPLAGTDVYVLHAPVVPKSIFRFPCGSSPLIVSAPGACLGRHSYRRVTFDGRVITTGTLRHVEIVKGGFLRFDLE